MIDNTTLIKLIENEPRLYQKELMTEAAESIQQHIEQHNKAYHHYQVSEWELKYLDKKVAALYDKEVTEDDYAIFIRTNGYAVMLRKAYEKLSARDKKKLMNGCTFTRL